MFVLITGKPRSGKSYYAVDHMIKNKNNYHNIYANVNGLKMKDNIKSLNFDNLMEIVADCKKIYEVQLSKLGESNDTNIIDKPIRDYLLSINFIKINPLYKKMKEERETRKNLSYFKRVMKDLISPVKSVSEFLPVLIIMDEAQNQMPVMVQGKRATPDELISWWISYHGHLYMDVFLLSQNYHKINAGYIYDIEYFLNAVPSSRSILGNNSGSFIYKHHLGTPFTNTNFVKKVKVKKSKDVFSAYESGDKVRTKSAVLPYLIYSAIGLVIVFFIFYFMKNYLYSPENTATELSVKKTINNITHSTQTKITNVIDNNVMKKKKYISLICISNTCTNKQNKINLHIDDLQSLLKDTNSKYLRSTKISKSMAEVYLLVSPEFLGLFKPRSENEKGNGFSIIN